MAGRVEPDRVTLRRCARDQCSNWGRVDRLAEVGPAVASRDLVLDLRELRRRSERAHHALGEGERADG